MYENNGISNGIISINPQYSQTLMFHSYTKMYITDNIANRIIQSIYSDGADRLFSNVD